MQKRITHIVIFLISFVMYLPGFAQNVGLDFNANSLNTNSPRPGGSYKNVSSFYLNDSIFTYHYSSTDSTWELDQKIYLSYNVKGFETEYLLMKRDSLTLEYNPEVRYLYAYNDNQLLEVELVQRFNSEIKTWTDSTRLTYKGFNDHGQETQILTEIKNTETSDWEGKYKVEKVYDYYNRLTSVIDKEFVNNSWVYNQKVDFSFDADGNISTKTARQFNDSLGLWVNDVQVTYNYDETDNLLSSVNSSWTMEAGGKWDNLFISEIEYNDEGKPVSVTQKSLNSEFSEETFELISQKSAFNENGLVEEVSYEVWLESEEEWIPADRSEYFYSEHIKTSLSLNDNEISCLFANPQKPGMVWLCNGMRQNDQYLLRVLNLQGKTLYTSNIQANQAFEIPIQLKQGVYIVNISGSTITHSEKVFFE